MADDELDLVEGRTAGQLMTIGYALGGVTTASAAAIFVCRLIAGPQPRLMIAIGAFGMLALLVSLPFSFGSLRRAKREQDRGYTSLLGRARTDDSLAYFDPRWGVVSGPGEPRPPTSRKTDVLTYLEASGRRRRP